MKKRNIILLAVLIVILGMIGTINYREAQDRSGVARAKGDMSTIAKALEAYHVDHQCYPGQVPLKSFSNQPDHDFKRTFPNYDHPDFSVLEKAYGEKLSTVDPGLSHPGLAGLTTPVAYLPKLPADPFINFRGEKGIPYAYHLFLKPPDTDYLIWSPGPDRTYDITDPNEFYEPDKRAFSIRLFLKT